MTDPTMLRRWHAGQTGLHPANPAGTPWDSRSAAWMTTNQLRSAPMRFQQVANSGTVLYDRIIISPAGYGDHQMERQPDGSWMNTWHRDMGGLRNGTGLVTDPAVIARLDAFYAKRGA